MRGARKGIIGAIYLMQPSEMEGSLPLSCGGTDIDFWRRDRMVMIIG